LAIIKACFFPSDRLKLYLFQVAFVVIRFSAVSLLTAG
jgi:hypothetical protein